MDGLIMQDDYDSRITEAKQFLTFCNDADSNNRAEALEDILFCSGDQWPVELQNSRSLESRPCLTINKLDAYCRQITNQQRQQRPRIKVHGMNNESDAKVAEILQGICRHIEVNSNAEDAYDHAFDFAVRMGWGYWRVETDYVNDKSFDQEIYIRRINNPFTVYFDPNSILPSGQDAEKCLITEVIRKETFRKMYPDADDGSGFHQRGTGDTDSEWIMKEDIRIAEYFWTERKPEDLILLSDGNHVFASELPKKALLEDAGIYEVSRRKSFKKVIKWCKMSGMEILEEGTWAGKYIPVVRVTGQQLIVHNKKKYFGLARQAKDPQKMYNFWQTALTESVALAPKAKWLLAEGQDEGHENEWAQANIKAMPVLRYKQTDIEGRPAPAPQRLQPEPPPAGVMAAAQALSADLMAVIGIYDPAQLPSGNISGKALQGQQQAVDMTNYHYYDNLTQSIAYTGRIILDLIPQIYDTERVMRIIGDDGKPELVTLNQQGQDEQGIAKILNDVTVGEYDVVMETGPGYNSKRQESVDAMLGMLQADPTLMQTAGDLIFRNMDFPGAEIIADRMAAANPMAQIDDKSPIPPQVQMQLKASQAQVQQMQQQIQQMQIAMQQRQDIEQVKQDNENKRKLMDVTARAHNTETMAEVKVHDQNTRAITSQNKVEIEAIMELLLHHMDTGRLEKEIAARNAEQYSYANQAVQDISAGANPLIQQ
jgi:hypothetical protein